eukprot:COSAG01_NODE_17355_length_1157_cov_259.726843_1_plen_208_part_00
MSQAPPATAGPAAASAAKGSAAAPSEEGGAPQDPAAAERSGSTEAAEEAVAAVVKRLCADVAAGEGGQQAEAQNDQDIIEEGGKGLSHTRKRGGRGAGRTTKKAKQQPTDTSFVKYLGVGGNGGCCVESVSEPLQASVILETFDKNTKYGPCVGIPRSRRWARAQRLNLKPPLEVMAIIEASHDELIERDIYCTRNRMLRIGTRWAD